MTMQTQQGLLVERVQAQGKVEFVRVFKKNNVKYPEPFLKHVGIIGKMDWRKYDGFIWKVKRELVAESKEHSCLMILQRLGSMPEDDPSIGALAHRGGLAIRDDMNLPDVFRVVLVNAFNGVAEVFLNEMQIRLVFDSSEHAWSSGKLKFEDERQTKEMFIEWRGGKSAGLESSKGHYRIDFRVSNIDKGLDGIGFTVGHKPAESEWNVFVMGQIQDEQKMLECPSQIIEWIDTGNEAQ